ncbi:MAG: 30S ribosomal protein S8e [Candidatus Marsarchaeota archaeon]|nr:30S ribosomal protein S8e [Candidatus Marsarchaeota archaeon]
MHRGSATKRSGNGKRKIKFKDKRRSEIGSYFSATKLAAAKVEANTSKIVRRRGGKRTSTLKSAAFVNLLTKDGYKRVRIKVVRESRDNRNFARQNIITKGTIIETDLGKAVVLNRPGREGSVNAKLVEG